MQDLEPFKRTRTFDVKCVQLAQQWLDGYSPGHYQPTADTVKALAYAIQDVIEDFFDTSSCSTCGPTHLAICGDCEDCETHCKCEACEDEKARPPSFWANKDREYESDLD